MGNFDRGGSSGGRRFGGRDAGRPSMHKATCSGCGRDCEVPFRPMPGKPVFCNDCFRKDEDSGSNRPERRGGFGKFGRRDSGRPGFGGGDRQMHEATCAECGKRCEVPFKPTGDKPVYCNDCFGAGKGESAGPKKPDRSKEQFEQLNAKLDRILKALENLKPKSEPKTEKPEKAPKSEAVIEKLGKAPKAEKPKKAKKKAKKIKDTGLKD